MAQHKLYLQLQQLPAKTCDRFGLYLGSPLHHAHQDSLQLWTMLRAYHPDFVLADAELFAAAFPGRVYDNARLRVLRSYLLEHLERFLAILELEHEQSLLRRLSRRASNRYALNQQRREIWVSPLASGHFRIDDLYEEFLLREDQLAQAVREDNRGSPRDLNRVLQALDSYYLTIRLKYLCAMADPNVPQLHPITEDASLPLILQMYQRLPHAQHPLTAIYYHLLHLFLGYDPQEHLAALDRLLKAHQGELEADERINLYTYWWNYLNFRHHAGAADALQAMFALSKEMIAVEVLFDKGSFTANHFKNIVSIAALLGEYAWAHDFLSSYRHRIPLQWRPSVYAYCRAFLLVEQGQFAEARRSLNDVVFFDPQYRISYQILQLRIYYETDDLDGLESVKSALRIFLYRNPDLPPSIQARTHAVARYTLRLHYLRGLRAPQARARRLLAEMQACTQLSARNWLYAKAQALIEG